MILWTMITAGILGIIVYTLWPRLRGRKHRKDTTGRRGVLALAVASVATVATLPLEGRGAVTVSNSLAPESEPWLAPPEVNKTRAGLPVATTPTSTPRATPKVKRTPAVRSAATGTRSAVMSQCRRWLGVRYRWGGGSLSGPTKGGLDCSGYTRLVYWQALKVQLPRVADAQMRYLRRVTSPRPGDLVFFLSSSGRAYHCGVFAKEGWMYAAPRSGDHVRLQEISAPRIRYATAPVMV